MPHYTFRDQLGEPMYPGSYWEGECIVDTLDEAEDAVSYWLDIGPGYGTAFTILEDGKPVMMIWKYFGDDDDGEIYELDFREVGE